MNKIYKFLKGRIIPKARNGQRFLLAGRSTMGFPVWVDTLTGHLYTSDIAGRRNPNRDWGTNDWSQWEDEGTTLGYFNALSAGLINGNDWIKKPAIPTKKNPNEIIVDGKKYASRTEWEKELQAKQITKQLNINKTKRTSIRRKITPKGQEYWNSQYQTFLDNMTEDLKAWLKLQGIDYSSALRMQGYLSGMGENIGNTGMDNKWGSASQKAWEHFVSTTMKNNPLQTPTKELPVVDAPDPFGYSTTNHYGNGMALKGLGFNNYAGLKNYVIANPNDQFAKDLKKRFGEDTSAWKQADVEGGLGVSGTYRGGYVGDFGDMARSMMNWAAETNATHDKKELASRTDSDGNVYGNSNVAKLFDKYSISSKIADIKKLKFPDLDFNLKQGNIGISTLGNQPGMFDAANYEGIV